MGKAIQKLEVKWPVIEIFGPTVQGEGVDQGVISNFIRFGGCDFKCDWCDTPYAVLPDEVRANSTKMGPKDILEELGKLEGWAPWIVITGGNPALHDLEPLIDKLHENDLLVAVETQGSKWREWMRKVDRLCLSPKPPSAHQKYNWATVQRFFNEGLEARLTEERGYEWMFIKIPIFDEKDLRWAVKVRKQLSDAMMFLSAGNDASRTVGAPDRIDNRDLGEIQRDLLMRSRVLTERAFKIPELNRPDVLVQTQYHVLLWGNEKGR